MMVDDRVEYFEPNDVLFGHNLDKIVSLDIPAITNMGINDAIEFYEIKRYFDKGTRSKTWSDADFTQFQKKSNELFSRTLQFFNSLNDANIVEQYSQVEVPYCSEFWALFDTCKLYKKISEETFYLLLHSEHISPMHIFKHKDLVRRYSGVLRNYAFEDEQFVRILVHVYEQDFSDTDKLYLSTELTKSDIETIVERYIDSEAPNINTLKNITEMRSSTALKVSDELRLKALRRYEQEAQQVHENGVYVGFGFQLSFSDKQIEEKKAEHSGNEFKVSYSTKWLLETLDYPSILNNFIYIFEYVDLPQMRSLHVSKNSDMGIFERITQSASTRIYLCSAGFKLNNDMATMQMNAYYNFLKCQNIRLEDVLQWTFTEYLQKEFNCAPIRVSFPTEGAAYSEKCVSIITALEALIKQFSTYVRKGEIDFELIGMSTVPTPFADIPSLVKGKYLYGSEADYKRITTLLFSDQCMLSYVPRIHEQAKEYTCLLDLLLNEQIYLSDYRENEYTSFEYLSKFGLVTISAEGQIAIGSKAKLAILRDMFRNEVVSRYHYPPAMETDIQDLLECGIIVEKSSLFSTPEVNYLNFLLNRSEYDNGLELRNKYSHGMQQVITDENVHFANYLVFLKIMVLLAIKINNDFCLKEEVSKRVL